MSRVAAAVLFFVLLAFPVGVASAVAVPGVAAPAVAAQDTGAPALAAQDGTPTAQADAPDAASGGPLTTVVVAEGETVEGPLEVSGGTVVVAGTVEGDLRAIGGRVVVADTGHVTGELKAYAGSVAVAGAVDGDVVTYGSTVALAGSSRFGGSVNAGGGTVVVAGTVDGSAQLLGGRVVLAPDAVVRGDLAYDARLDDRGGRVAGAIEPTHQFLGPVGTLVRLLRFVPLLAPVVAAFVGFGALRLDPAFARLVVERTTGAPLRSGAVGLVGVLAALCGVGLLALTLVGLPVAVVVLLLFAALAFVGLACGQAALGVRLLALVGRRSDPALAPIALGAFSLVALVASTEFVAALPAVGTVALAAVALVGLGGVANVVYARRPTSRRR